MKKTRPFSTTSGDYLSVLISLWLPRYGWIIILPIALCAALGFVFDERLLLVALMLLFIVVPMLMSFLYTYYMLTPEARRAVLRKEVEIADGEYIRLTYLNPESQETEDDGNNKDSRMLLPVAGKDSRVKSAPLRLPPPETIQWTDVLGVRSTSRFTVYLLRGPRLMFLLVPHAAFIREALA